MKKYDNYKDSGIEWIGFIPCHWDRIRIKNLVEVKITDGPHETPIWHETGIPFISAEAIKGNQIDLNFKRGYISEEQHLEYCKKSKVLKDDILFCKSGSTTGKSALVSTNVDFGIWSPLAIIRANKNLIDFKYLFHSIQSSLFQNQVETAWTFGTQPNIGMGSLENLWIAIPNKEEQSAIVNFLDHKTSQIDHLIAKKEQFIKLLEEERVAVINQAVTKGLDSNVPMKDSGLEWLGVIPEHWEVPKIWHLIMMKKLEIQDGNHGSLYPKQEDFKTEGVYFIKPRDIRNGAVNFSTCDCLTHEHANSLRIGFSKPNDLLLVNRGGTIGRMARMKTIPNNLDYVLINPQMTYIRCKEDLDSDYAYYQCLSSVFQESLEQVKAYGSTFSFLGLSNMGDFPFVKPPIHEQIDISNFINKKLDEIQSIIYKVNNEIELLKEYKTALISEVVTGKVDVSTSSTQV